MTQKTVDGWVGFELPFRECDGTYQFYKGELPPVDTTKYQSIKTLQDVVDHHELLSIDSATACYIDVDFKTGQFYRDQQDCVIWKIDQDTGHVVACVDDNCKIGVVANNLAEFFARVNIENVIWNACSSIDTWSISTERDLLWSAISRRLNPSCLEYLSYYYHKTE